MIDLPEKNKPTIKCPECDLEYSAVDMAPHGMWEIGTVNDLSFACVRCETVLLRVHAFLGFAADGGLSFRVKLKQCTEGLRQVIKMILCNEFTGIGEELIDNIEEDVLESLGMEKKGGE